MGKLIIEKVGTAASHVFFEIGNGLNISHITKPKFIDRKTTSGVRTLEEDWERLGGEVRTAFERFERTYK